MDKTGGRDHGPHGPTFNTLPWPARCSLLIALLVMTGCGTPAAITTSDANRERGAEGQLLLLDDIEAILSDSSLSDDEKRNLLEAEGIRDPDLLDALISDF